MPDMYFDVDTAITECPVNLLPLLDATDFKTIEDAVAYNAAGLALYWHFCTSAGVYTVTAVTPTTAGNYDWTDQGAAGVYTIEIPASGGASINNDTEGYGWFTGMATGVLPWRGPVIGFRAAAINDALMDGGDNLDVNTVQWLGTACATPTVAGVPEVDVTHIGGDAQSGTDLKDFADAGYDPATNKVQGVVLVDTITTYTGNTVQTGDSFARLGAPAGASVSADLLAIDNFVDGLETTIGAAGAGLTALATQASVNTLDDFLDTEVAAILAAVDTEVAAIKAKTDSLTFTVAGQVDANMLAITGDTGSATKLERVLSGNTTGTVGAASSTTSVVTSALDPAASVTDQYKGLILKFDDATTTAALRGQGTDITASTSAGVLTVTALTTAPVSGDTFTVS